MNQYNKGYQYINETSDEGLRELGHTRQSYAQHLLQEAIKALGNSKLSEQHDFYKGMLQSAKEALGQ